PRVGAREVLEPGRVEPRLRLDVGEQLAPALAGGRSGQVVDQPAELAFGLVLGRVSRRGPVEPQLALAPGLQRAALHELAQPLDVVTAVRRLRRRPAARDGVERGLERLAAAELERATRRERGQR